MSYSNAKFLKRLSYIQISCPIAMQNFKIKLIAFTRYEKERKKILCEQCKFT